MDKFLLAENPMRAPKGGLCIIKTVLPIGVFEVMEGHIFFAMGKNVAYRHYSYKGEHYTLRLHYYGGYPNNNVPEYETVIEMSFKDMDKAWHWFAAYLDWEDKHGQDTFTPSIN